MIASERPPASANLQRLFLLRTIVILGQGAMLATAYYGLHMVLPYAPMLVTLSLLTLLNIATWWRLRQAWPVTDPELFAQLLLDVTELSALLYFSGGSTNPFISLNLLPLAIAAATLPRRYSWGMAAVTVFCYTLLMFYFRPLPHVHDYRSGDFNLHVHGMWFTFILSAGLISYFVVGMSQSLRERDRMLSNAREEALRNEQIIALGTLAAGAAHELGTPLSTMAVVVRELELDHRGQPELAANLRILQDQVDGCKHILTQLLAQSAVMRAESGTALRVDTFLNQILAKWQLMRPETKLAYSAKGIEPTPMIIAEQTLSQSIMNLLNNAADASPDSVEVRGDWSASALTIDILDRGPGLPQDALQNIGQAFFTTKGPNKGFGLGLFLSNATISRFGGKVSLFNRDGGGVCTRILLPLSQIQRDRVQ